ncbi:MAG TPA: alpha/beta hydrolase, partial [Chloroflexota bacterium]
VELVQFLAPKGYVVYSFMRRDHKRAAGQPGYIEEWNQTQEDIAAFIHFVRALEPDAALFLVGDRLGARIVASYALHQPEGLDGVIAFRADAISSEPGGTIQRLSRALAELWPAFGPPPPATSQMESLSGHQPDERASGGPAEDSEMRTDQELEDNPADLPVPFLAVDSTVAAPDAVSAVLEGVESWLERRID